MTRSRDYYTTGGGLSSMKGTPRMGANFTVRGLLTRSAFLGEHVQSIWAASWSHVEVRAWKAVVCNRDLH